MAELIMTEDERRALSFLEWDDEALGRAVKKAALIIADKSGRDAIPVTAAAGFLVSMAVEANSTESVGTVGGLVNGDEQLGDWKITIERVD